MRNPYQYILNEARNARPKDLATLRAKKDKDLTTLVTLEENLSSSRLRLKEAMDKLEKAYWTLGNLPDSPHGDPDPLSWKQQAVHEQKQIKACQDACNTVRLHSEAMGTTLFKMNAVWTELGRNKD